MERYALALALWIVVAACLVGMRRQSPLHLYVLGLISTALVGAYFPVLSSFIQPSSWRNVVQAPDALVLAAQGEFLAYAVGLGLALAVAWALGALRAHDAPARIDVSSRERHRDRFVACALVGLGLLLYAAYVARIGIASLVNREDYAEKYLVSQGLGPYAFGLNLIIAGCLWAEAADVSRFERWSFRLLALGIGVWSLVFISVRTNFVVLCIGYAWILCRERRIELARVRLSLVAVLVGLYVSLEAFSLLRGATSQGGLDRAVNLICSHAEDSVASIVGGSELSHPFLTTVEVEMFERDGDLAGRSYVDAFPAFLPLFILPDRPLTLSEKFVNANYPDLAERGGGASFSLVAEAWWNFGSLLGPLLVGCFFGACLLLVEGTARRHRSGVVARLIPYLVYLVLIAHRSEFAIFLKQGLSILLPALAFDYAAEIVWLARHPRGARLAAHPARTP